MHNKKVCITQSNLILGTLNNNNVFTIDDSLYEQEIKSNSWNKFSRITQLLLVCSKYFQPDTFSVGNEFAMFLGTQYSSCNSVHSFDMQAQLHGPLSVSPSNFPDTVLNAPSCYLSIELKCSEEIYNICTGINAGIDAVGLGYEYIKAGKKQHILSGAYDEFGDLQSMGYHNNKPIAEAIGLLEIRLTDIDSLKGLDYLELCAYSSGNIMSDSSCDSLRIATLLKEAISKADFKLSEVNNIYIQTTMSVEKEKAVFHDVFQILEYMGKLEFLDRCFFGVGAIVLLHHCFKQGLRENKNMTCDIIVSINMGQMSVLIIR